jgi:probable poly-beta-1,6-N-acetyl-D-glucosamine export protein
MEKDSEFFSEIEFLRAFAILAVISIHVSAYFTKMDTVNFLTFLYISIGTFSHFAVPLFVSISGFVLYNKYKGTFSLKLFYKKRLISVLPQYTIFSILAILFIYLGTIYLEKIWNYGIFDIIYQFFTGTAYYHLWFFVVIIQLYILYPIIEKIFTKSVEKRRTLELLIFVLIVQTLYHIFSILDLFLIGTVTLFLDYIFYFVLGMYVRSHYKYYKNKIMNQKYRYLLFFPLLLMTILGIGYEYIKYFIIDTIPHFFHVYPWTFKILTPLYYIIIFTLCLYISLKISERVPNIFTKYFQIIGKYSFGIYLIHAFILFVLASILFPKIGFDVNNWMFYPIVFTLVLILSLASVYIINKFPYHQYIIGSSR